MQAGLHKTGPDADRGDGGSGWFAATHWSVVLAAGEADPEKRQRALETLCQVYWGPIFIYLRQAGKQPQDAEDTTQAFLAHFLERHPFAKLSPEKGRFRSFLLKALQNFVADEHEWASAAKRGGRCSTLRFDAETAEHWLASSLGDAPPEAAFDQCWATTVLKRALDALGRESRECGRAEIFAQLSAFLATEGNAEAYGLAGAALGMTRGAVSVAVHRLRQRYRELIRKEIAHTVPRLGEIDVEMHYLFQVLNR